MLRRPVVAVAVVAALGRPAVIWAQTAPSLTELTVVAGRPLDIVLDERVVIKRVGQSVTGVVVQPVYAYDRIVVPSGTKVHGHVASLEDPSKFARTRAMLSGDLTPRRRVVLQFDTLVLESGDTLPIHTVSRTEITRVKRTEAPSPEDDADDGSSVHRLERQAKQEVKSSIADARQRGRDILAEITQPGRTQRMKDTLVQRLPYHPQWIDAGTGYHAEFIAPLEFGAVIPTELASASARPAPSSILTVRLLTDLDSAKTPRGTTIKAIVTQPVFSSDHLLIIPEGTLLEGEVTLAKSARLLHKNGQLRFLFETIHRDAAPSSPLVAQLQAVETSADDRVAIDEEGGATLKSPKTRFIAPALALLALRGSLDHETHPDPDGDGHMIQSNNQGAMGVGGFLGMGVMGFGLSFVARPVGVALSAYGAARTMYTNVVGKGREVRFPADTLMQLQLAPGPSSP
jgi:hypothetical protein